MMTSLEHLLSSQRVLLLQGPMGDFFAQLASWLRTKHIEVHKVNFNGGDRFFYRDDQTRNYRGKLRDFSNWLTVHLQNLQIDTVVCFGDCRLYHALARDVCQHLGIRFLVFEEGYLRPDYITLECDGVNAHSKLDLSLLFNWPIEHDYPQPTNPRFSLMVWSACLYYLAWMVLHPLYPHYQHHRLLTPFQEIVAWLRALRRRMTNSLFDRRKQAYIREHWVNQYFIVALQVHNDSQVRVHSDYNDVTDFLVESMHSFAQHAAPEHYLVIKHHPMDRGYRSYRHLIQVTAKQLGIEARVLYVCDVHLPSLIKQSLGLVTINSTTGLQALFHGKPVMALGRAIYNQPHLTFQGQLKDFWQSPPPVDHAYYWHFRAFLIYHSQLNGSFYGHSPWMSATPFPVASVSDTNLLKQSHG
jgi:capsular polysaccharide export protein